MMQRINFLGMLLSLFYLTDNSYKTLVNFDLSLPRILINILIMIYYPMSVPLPIIWAWFKINKIKTLGCINNFSVLIFDLKSLGKRSYVT